VLSVRRAEDRGHANHGWLETSHTFSFADYHDPAFMGFRSLRVINDDRVAPGAGFPTHPHRDMEIVTYVLEGAIAHRDSMGNGSTIRPGDVQRMTAGTGVTHSELNASKSDALRFLQVWILPSRRGLAPSYEQKAYSPDDKRGTLRLVVSPDEASGSVTIHQDVCLYATLLGPGQSTAHTFAGGRFGWVQVARGRLRVGGTPLGEGDGLAIADEAQVTLEGEDDAEALLFDLA
jgi:redox-sensitive bicupin YhaK (pirin superfamily)